MITGIERGNSDEGFIEELMRQHPKLKTIRDEIRGIKLITKTTCCNPMKGKSILKAQPNIAKWFLKKKNQLRYRDCLYSEVPVACDIF